MKNIATVGNLFILGDSYSTFEECIPEGYEYWYSRHYADEINPPTDVNRANQTWWYQFVEETGAHLVLNSSYSGTTICHTGYNGEDCSYKSFIARFNQLIDEDFFVHHSIDTFIIFGGTNDSWADAPIGEIQYSDWEKEELYSVLPAFCYLLHRVKEHLPNTRIVVVMNTDLKQEIVEGFRVACENYDVERVELQDIDKLNGHPSAAGMKQIKEQILNDI